MTRRRKGHKIGEIWTASRRIRGRLRTVRVKKTGRHREKVRVEKGLKYQSKFLGRTKRALRQDISLHAKPPGRRRSASGKRYFEHRANRSDIGKI